MANAELSTYDDIPEIEPVPQEGFNVIWARVFSLICYRNLLTSLIDIETLCTMARIKNPGLKSRRSPNKNLLPSPNGCRSHISFL
jgi:hypothetical protein